MKNLSKELICCLIIFVLISACPQKSETVSEIGSFPVDSMDGIITRSDVSFDEDVSSDGNGSLMVNVNEPTTIRLYETGDIDIENARLIYTAKLRTRDLNGQAYIEMWCHFPGKGEYFSRALHSPLSGTNEWTSQETPFILKKGENPDNVKINLVVNGAGKVWIDDIRLIQSPL